MLRGFEDPATWRCPGRTGGSAWGSTSLLAAVLWIVLGTWAGEEDLAAARILEGIDSCTADAAAPTLRWRVIQGRGAAEFRRLWTGWDADMRLLVQRVNRKDYRHLLRARFVVVPEDSAVPERNPGPFPNCVASAQGVEKIVFVEQGVQAFGAYEAGRLVWWGAVSTGTERHPTPNGLYHANWRSRVKRSTVNRNWLMPWYVNLHTSMGVAFHAYELPGHPASYGCIRLLREDARWLYDWLEVGRPDPQTPGGWLRWGTPVVVLGTAPREGPYPWERLAEDPAADRVDPAMLETVLARYRWAITQRRGEPRE